MTDRELMQQALDALEHLQTDIEWQYKSPTRTMLRKVEKALRARLAQPEPEPVAWMYQQEDTGVTMCAVVQQVGSGFEKNNPRWQKIAPLYTAPPQREWQGLTDEERIEVLHSGDKEGYLEYAKGIEAKLKAKNDR